MSHWAVVRDYNGAKPMKSVLIASNQQGRIEPFIFHSREDAEAAADALKRQPGHISTILIYHGVEDMGETEAGKFIAGLGGLRAV